MSSTDQNEWPERMLCAKCGVLLGEDYVESSIGLRFCAECYGGTIREKERERSAEIYLKGRCSKCGGSLINGYRLSDLGVLYCISCHEHLPRA